MSQVVLNKEEARWVSRNVSKTLTILEAASQKDPKILERRTYKLLNEMRPKAAALGEALDLSPDNSSGGTLTIDLTTGQKTALTALVDATIKSLTEMVLPKYVERNQLDYAAATRIKIDLIREMRRKLR